ncbi:MarR family winged helix-turn-helix transcriptional regulator [Pararhodobacter zhoushanensis]|uniref:MarR family transcriptional regulator n=1 Tax=Pararhodobacter zhoushanensis TaxID=2479545 RepID=A0ABT3H2L9_9RHOB|nr:MarR family transcriptional regulator [Pararhodobacter zhoushanensis]MCW1934058.1 MarR family transcriptional regulator [Pararhodobacter zhoushanensis]
MPVSALDDHLGYWMRAASNAVSQGFARRLADQGVTVAEWAVLRVLYDAPAMAPSELAARMSLTKGAISKLSDRLQAKGLLTRADHPDDRRGHLLDLTATGRALVPSLAAIADANDTAFFDVLDPPEKAALDQLIKALVVRHGLTGTPVD